jgi:hypothetical protein
MNELPRILTVSERVRSSELFPRIRDAELGMIKYNKDLLERIEDKKLRKIKKKEEKERLRHLPPHQIPPKKVVTYVPPKSYFTSFVLDRDPRARKYMPFDTVYFPKLFDEDISAVPPESIDKLWMFGFQDLALEENKEKLAKKKR